MKDTVLAEKNSANPFIYSKPGKNQKLPAFAMASVAV